MKNILCWLFGHKFYAPMSVKEQIEKGIDSMSYVNKPIDWCARCGTPKIK